MAAIIIDTMTVDTIGATDIIVASGLISLAGATVIIVIKNADNINKSFIGSTYQGRLIPKYKLY